MKNVGGIIVIVFLVGWGIWMALPHAPGTPGGDAVAAAPVSDPIAPRRAMKAYWDRTHNDYHLALNAVQAAMINPRDAEQAKQISQDGANDASHDVPDGWGDISQHMSNTLAGLLDLAGKIESDADRQSIEDASEYQRTEFAEAEHLEREAYVNAGGDRRDLSP